MLERLLSKENINKVFLIRTQEIINIIESLRSNDKFNDILSKAMDIIYEILEKEYFNSVGNQRIWQSYFMLNDCLPFYKRMASPHAYKIERELETQEIIFNDNLVKNGATQTIEFDLTPFKKFFEDNTKPWEIRIVFLTHSKDENGNLVSFIEQGARCNVKGLSDEICRKNPGTNEYFTNWRLRNLSLFLFEIKARFMTLLQKSENVSEYLSDIYGELKYICKNVNTTMEFENLNNDMETLSQFLTDLFINYLKDEQKFRLSIKNTMYSCK